MKLEIQNSNNTWIDVTDYVAYNGFKWERYDVDSPDAGRTLDAVMHRGRVATKIRADVTCRPLKSTELRILLNLILPEYINVRYDDPMYGQVTKRMYSNNNPATYLIRKRGGLEEWWNGVSFPLIEV